MQRSLIAFNIAGCALLLGSIAFASVAVHTKHTTNDTWPNPHVKLIYPADGAASLYLYSAAYPIKVGPDASVRVSQPDLAHLINDGTIAYGVIPSSTPQTSFVSENLGARRPGRAG
jgi:hypothetical protein